MVNGRTFALGGAVSVQLALAGRAVASTGSATEEASQSGILQRTLRRRRLCAADRPCWRRGRPCAIFQFWAYSALAELSGRILLA